MIKYRVVCFTDKGEKVFGAVLYDSQNEAMASAEVMAKELEQLADVIVLMYGAEPVKG